MNRLSCPAISEVKVCGANSMEITKNSESYNNQATINPNNEGFGSCKNEENPSCRLHEEDHDLSEDVDADSPSKMQTENCV